MSSRADVDRLREAIRRANARYEMSAYEPPSFSVATDMYIELARVADRLGD